MTSTLSLNRRVNLSRKISWNNVNRLADKHTFARTLIKETLKVTPPFMCSEFSVVHCINPTYCRNILKSWYGHCKGTQFLIFLLKILKDCDNFISLGTRSHILAPRNKMDSVPCLTEFTFVMCHFGENYMGARWVQINISFKMG